MAARRHFGSIPGIAVGALFASRADVAAAGVHRPRIAGISGAAAEGADSIVLNGGYEDDEDRGDEVTYTGHGGNDPETGRQIANQALHAGNRALAKNCLDGLPVRVVRGWREPSGYGPPTGFRYDGLYRVVRHWSDVGQSGFRIWRFRLERDDPSAPPWEFSGTSARESQAEYRPEHVVQRLVRNSAVIQHVKDLHQYRCQICGIRLETPGGPYAQGAHIRPLDRPHNGPDEPANVLCLCPNDHVLLETGALVIRDDLTVIERPSSRPLGQLRTVRGHNVSIGELAYHRRMFT